MLSTQTREVPTGAGSGLSAAILSLCFVPPLAYAASVPDSRALVLTLGGAIGTAGAAWFFGTHRATSLLLTLVVWAVARPLPELDHVGGSLLGVGYCLTSALIGASLFNLVFGTLGALGHWAAWRDLGAASIMLMPPVVALGTLRIAVVAELEFGRLRHDLLRYAGAFAVYCLVATWVIALFALLTRATSMRDPSAYAADTPLSFAASFYQSVLVFCTIGPPVAPISWIAKVLVAAEAVCSLGLFGVYQGLMFRSLDKR